MSKRRRSTAASKPQVKTDALVDAVNGVLMKDAFQNALTRQGLGMPNHSNATAYPLQRLTKDYTLMTSLYRNNWIVRRLIDVVPTDMLKNGWKYTSDITPEKIDQLYKAERKTRIKKSILDALKWARLYGGSAALMLIDGQEERLEEPLDLDSILPGDFKGLLVMDRWSGIFPGLDRITDINSSEFGLPEHYEFRAPDKVSNINTQKVHHSRVLRFCGDGLPLWEHQAEQYWGASIIEAIFEELKKRDNTSANLAGLIFLSNLRILKMADFGEMLAGTSQKAQEDLYNTIQAMNALMNNFSLQVLSKEDDFQSVSASFGGLAELYELFMLDIAGAAGIPAVKMFGRSPQGMNATGESDLKNYDSVVEQRQEEDLSPILDKLIPVLAMSTFGEIPDDLDHVFNPVSSPSKEEIANFLKATTETVLAFHDRGIISNQLALKEAKQLSEGTGVFTNITDEDIAKAEDEITTFEDEGMEDAPSMESETE